MSIQETLNERGKTHGDYAVHSYITQGLKEFMRDQANWSKLARAEAEALDMIAHKIGRILAGNPHFHDHWYDIAGYSTLVANLLDPEKVDAGN